MKCYIAQFAVLALFCGSAWSSCEQYDSCDTVDTGSSVLLQSKTKSSKVDDATVHDAVDAKVHCPAWCTKHTQAVWMKCEWKNCKSCSFCPTFEKELGDEADQLTEAQTTCTCDTPMAGAAGNNQYTCSDGFKAWCATTEACYATWPFPKGDWGAGCQETCACSTPNKGTAGSNEYTCTDQFTGYCAADQACYATSPFVKGDWDAGCRTSSATAAPMEFYFGSYLPSSAAKGAVLDAGTGYGTSSTRASSTSGGQSYGWDCDGDSSVNYAGGIRGLDRGDGLGLNHFDRFNTCKDGETYKPVNWQLEVPNGQYDVQVNFGEAYKSGCEVEGVNAGCGDTAFVFDPPCEVSKTVTITDGKFTVTGYGHDSGLCMGLSKVTIQAKAADLLQTKRKSSKVHATDVQPVHVK